MFFFSVTFFLSTSTISVRKLVDLYNALPSKWNWLERKHGQDFPLLQALFGYKEIIQAIRQSDHHIGIMIVSVTPFFSECACEDRAIRYRKFDKVR